MSNVVKFFIINSQNTKDVRKIFSTKKLIDFSEVIDLDQIEFNTYAALEQFLSNETDQYFEEDENLRFEYYILSLAELFNNKQMLLNLHKYCEKYNVSMYYTDDENREYDLGSPIFKQLFQDISKINDEVAQKEIARKEKNLYTPEFLQEFKRTYDITVPPRVNLEKMPLAVGLRPNQFTYLLELCQIPRRKTIKNTMKVAN